jgi:hypothetical protein
MSQTITLELPDALYAAVQQAAQAHNQTPDEWLLDHLPDLVSDITNGNGGSDPDMHAADEAAYWAAVAAQQADLDAEWAAVEAEVAAARRNPPPPDAAEARVDAILSRWRGKPMTEEEAVELAMSEEIAEWNLDLD